MSTYPLHHASGHAAGHGAGPESGHREGRLTYRSRAQVSDTARLQDTKEEKEIYF